MDKFPPHTPRFRGSAIKVETGYIYEIYFSLWGDGDERAEVFMSKNTYPTREICLEELKKEINFMIKSIAKAHPELGIDVHNYHDLKTQEVRKWDKNKNH